MACPKGLENIKKTLKNFQSIQENYLKKLSPMPKILSTPNIVIGTFWKPAGGRFLSETTPLEQQCSELTWELDAPPSVLGLRPQWVKACLLICYFLANSIHTISLKL